MRLSGGWGGGGCLENKRAAATGKGGQSGLEVAVHSKLPLAQRLVL